MATPAPSFSSKVLFTHFLALIILISSIVAFAIPTPQSNKNNFFVSSKSTTNERGNYQSISERANQAESSFVENTCTAQFTITSNKMSAAAASTTTKLRTVNKILPRPPTHWVGDGFKVHPVFDKYAFTELLSPLLMFDYGAPQQFPPRPGKSPLGVGQHPHRGFETVTVAFSGEVEHSDSTGKSDVIREGDVQWMTAGRGIIHQEYHSKNFTETGGVFEMCQLWVNLPKKHKMTKPGYQAITKDSIPTVQLPLGTDTSADAAVGTARIIAGELGTTKGAANTFSPVQVWDVIIPKSGTEIELPFPSNQNLILFVRRGTIEIITDNETTTSSSSSNNSRLSPQDVAVMKLDGISNAVKFRTYEENTSVLVLGGEPLNEPIAARGPFVMNTNTEIQQAMFDYQNGKMGR